MQEIILVKENETSVYSPNTGSNMTFRLNESGDVVVGTKDLEVVLPRINDADFENGAQKIVISSDFKFYAEKDE